MPAVEMRSLSADQYQEWRKESLMSYAAEKVEAGNWPEEEARERAEKSFQELLPEGQATPHHHLYAIWAPDRDQSIGIFWFHIAPDKRRVAFIYDFVISEEFRGKGYGKAALLAGEQAMQSLGAKSSALHVFAHNTTARKLYEKCGYAVTNLNMSKIL